MHSKPCSEGKCYYISLFPFTPTYMARDTYHIIVLTKEQCVSNSYEHACHVHSEKKIYTIQAVQ